MHARFTAASGLRMVSLMSLLTVAGLTSSACSSGAPTGSGSASATNGQGNGTSTNGSGSGSGTIKTDNDQAVAVREVSKTVGNGTKLAISTGELAQGATTTRVLTVSNSGSFSSLTLSKLAFEYAPTPIEGDKPAFACAVVKDATETPCSAFSGIDLFPPGKGSPSSISINITFLKYADAAQRSATLRVASNDVKGNKDYAISFYTTAGQARIGVQPQQIDFGYVPVGTSPVSAAAVLNIGSSDLVITQVDLSQLDKEFFKVVWNGKEFATGGPVNLEPPAIIKPSDSIEFSVLFTAKDDKPRSYDIRMLTNDASLTVDGVGVKRVPVKVNSTGPCLLLSPKAVVFGATPVGQAKEQILMVKSCGDEAVVISKIAFDTPPGAGNFSVKWELLKPTAAEPTTDAPLKLAPNASAALTLVYTPTKLSPTSATGTVTQDTASLTVTSNTAAGTAKATLEGYGASGDCPTPSITIAEGDTVTPQTVLHLDGKQSYATGGTIAKFQWEVEQAKGSVSLFAPNATSSAVTFQPNVAGDYTFRLHVWDQGGKKSCAPAEKKVKVIPDQAIHVELIWKTPGDKDETDSGPGVGTDLDLHFAHQYAAGQDYDGDKKPDPWFAGQYDCFWFNCGNGNTVEWGSYDPNVDDDPSLDRDDTDGAGPENLNLTLPEDGKTYSVGVHYYNDFALGKSKAIIRIYIYGVLQFEVTSPDLIKGDMWYVAKIGWPQAEIESAQKAAGDTIPFITKKYPAPSLD